MRDLIRTILKEEVVDITDIQDELLSMPLNARRQLQNDLTNLLSTDETEDSLEIEEYDQLQEILNKLNWQLELINK